MHSFFQSVSRRRVRRHIQLALAGAAVGTLCLALPSLANDDVSVTNTNASGAGSLSQAITDGGHVVFGSPLTNGTQFTSALPSITNDLSIDSNSGLNTVTVTPGLTTGGDSELDLNGDGTEGDYSITSDLTATDQSQINITNAYTVNGSATADGVDSTGKGLIIYLGESALNGATVKALNGGNVDLEDSTVTLTGDITADGEGYNGHQSEIDVNNSTLNAVNLKATGGGYVNLEASTVGLTGDITADGAGSDGDLSNIDVDDTSLNAVNLKATRDGYINIHESTVTLTGDAIADGGGNSGDGSEIDVYDGSNLNAVNLKATSGGYVDINTGNVNLSGDVIVDGAGKYSSQVDVDSVSSLNAQTLQVTNGGYAYITDGSSASFTGDATVDGQDSDGEQSEIQVEDSVFSAANLSVTNGGYVFITNNSAGNFTGDATVDGERSNGDPSEIQVDDSHFSAANLNITNGGYVFIADNSFVTLGAGGSGTATADGKGSNGYLSEIDVVNGSVFNGNAVASNGGLIYVAGGEITHNVTINAGSILSTYGYGNYLSTEGGGTTFNANSLFVPDILSNPVFVGNLVVNNTAQIQPWISGNYTNPVPVGTQYGRPVIDYNSITGQFSSTVISPLDVGVEYADSEGTRTDTPDTEDSGEVQLYLNSNQVDFNKLPGSENAHSLGTFLDNVINQSNTDPDVFTLANLPESLQSFAAESIGNVANDGNLRSFDEGMPTNYSSQNAQAYWNQKSFVESILENLENDSDMENGGNSFALNQMTSAQGTGAQLAALRQATLPGVNGLDYAEGNNSHAGGVWAAYNGNHQHTDGDSGVGSTDWSSSTDGYTVGYTGGGNGFSWGAAVGHQKSTLNFDDLDASGDQSGWNAGLYASLKGKNTYLNGVLGYGNFDNDSYGIGGDASFKTKATSASLELGRHLSNNKSGGLTPYASVLWTRIKQDDALVTGSDIGLTLNSGSNNVFATQLGLRYNHRMYDEKDTLKGGWQAGAAWLYQGGDTGFPVNIGSTFAPNAGTFAVQSTPLAGDSLVVQLGAYGRIHGNLIGFAGYQGTFGSSQDINAVNAGVGYQF